MVTRGDRALSAITAPVSPQRPLAIMLLLPWLRIDLFHSICIEREMEEVRLRSRMREAPFHFSLFCFPRAHLDTSEVTQRHHLENMASNSSPSCWGPRVITQGVYLTLTLMRWDVSLGGESRPSLPGDRRGKIGELMRAGARLTRQGRWLCGKARLCFTTPGTTYTCIVLLANAASCW